MDTKLRDQLRKQVAYSQALLDAEEVLASAPSEEIAPVPDPIDLVALRTSIRNRVLAGSGDKAAILGTLSTEPAKDAKTLSAELDIYPSLAEAMVEEAGRLREAALALDLTPDKEPFVIAPGDVGKVEDLGL